MELNPGLILSTCLELRFNFDALDRMKPWFKTPSVADLILTLHLHRIYVPWQVLNRVLIPSIRPIVQNIPGSGCGLKV